MNETTLINIPILEFNTGLTVEKLKAGILSYRKSLIEVGIADKNNQGSFHLDVILNKKDYASLKKFVVSTKNLYGSLNGFLGLTYLERPVEKPRITLHSSVDREFINNLK